MSNIKIGIKLRTKRSKIVQWTVHDNNALQSVNLPNPCKFTFDHLFLSECRNNDVYSTMVEPIVEMCLQGYNGTILVYGQTSSGKSETMMGTDEDPGIQLLAIEQIFQRKGHEFKIRVGYIDVYKEKVYDLLNKGKKVTVDSNDQSAIKLTNQEVAVESAAKAIEVLFNGCYKRKTSTNDKLKLSSKSHAVFRITIESEDKTNGTIQVSYLTFVHVAGSELISGNSDSVPIKEDDNNKSLLWLNFVIHELSEGKKDIDFGSSRLTHIMQDSLAGNANMAIICNIRTDAVDETISTLKFASQAKNVQTTPVRNQAYTDLAFIKIHEDIRSMECSFLSNEHLNTSDLMLSNIQPSDFEVERKRGPEPEIETRCKRVKTSIPSASPSPSTASNKVECCSLSSCSTGSDMLALEYQLKDIVNIKVENLRLMKELEQVRAAHENEKKWMTEQMTAAKLDLQKSEFVQVQDQIIFSKMRVEFEQSIERLTKENENLKIALYKKETKNSNADEHVRQLMSQLEALHATNQTNTDLVLKQKESLMRMGKENYELKQQNGRLMGKNKFPPPSATEGHPVESGIQQKIRRLEDVMAKNIQQLKNEFQCKTNEMRNDIRHGQRKENSSFPSTYINSQPLIGNNIDIVTSSSHTMAVSNALVGRIFGRGGVILNSIKQKSGARITVSERSGNSDRNVTITGKAESVNLAVDLIKMRMDDSFQNKNDGDGPSGSNNSSSSCSGYEKGFNI